MDELTSAISQIQSSFPIFLVIANFAAVVGGACLGVVLLIVAPGRFEARDQTPHAEWAAVALGYAVTIVPVAAIAYHLGFAVGELVWDVADQAGELVVSPAPRRTAGAVLVVATSAASMTALSWMLGRSFQLLGARIYRAVRPHSVDHVE